MVTKFYCNFANIKEKNRKIMTYLYEKITGRIAMITALMLACISGLNVKAASYYDPLIVPEPLSTVTGLPSYAELPSEVRIYWGASLEEKTLSGRFSNVVNTVQIASRMKVVKDGADSYLSIDLEGLYSGPDVYTVEVLANSVSIGGSANDKLTFQYLITNELGTDRIVSNPSKGEVNGVELSEITLTWPGYYLNYLDDFKTQAVKFASGMLMEAPTNAATPKVELVEPVTKDDYTVYGALKVKLDKTYTTPGWYTLYLPVDLLGIQSTDGSVTGLTNESLYLYYHLNNFYTYPIDQGSMKGELSSIIVYGDGIELAEGANVSAITLTAEGTETKIYGKTVQQVAPDANGIQGLQINLSEPYLSPYASETISVNIPANTFKMDGKNYDQPISYSFYLKGEMTDVPNSDPAPGVVTSLKNISLNWNDAVLERRSGELTFSVNGGAPEVVLGVVTSEIDSEVEGGSILSSSVEIDLGKEYTAPGTYVLNIPAGYVYAPSFEVMNKAVTLTYVIESDEPEQPEQPEPDGKYITAEMDIDPLNGTYMAFMGNVDIQWENTTLQNTTVNKSNITVTLDGKKINLGNSDRISIVTLTESDEVITWDVTALRMSFGSLSGKTGTVTISIAEGTVKTTDGLINKPIELTYHLCNYYGMPPVWEPAPEGEGVNLTKGDAFITVSWKDYEVELVNPYAPMPAFYEDNSETDRTRMPLTDMMTVENGKLVINVSNLEEGSYSICLTEGSVILKPNTITADALYSFSIVDTSEEGDTTGIAGIEADKEGQYRVYDINGVNLLNTRDAKEIRSLTPGLYIVNGRKVVVRN